MRKKLRYDIDMRRDGYFVEVNRQITMMFDHNWVNLQF